MIDDAPFVARVAVGLYFGIRNRVWTLWPTTGVSAGLYGARVRPLRRRPGCREASRGSGCNPAGTGCRRALMRSVSRELAQGQCEGSDGVRAEGHAADLRTPFLKTNCRPTSQVAGRHDDLSDGLAREVLGDGPAQGMRRCIVMLDSERVPCPIPEDTRPRTGCPFLTRECFANPGPALESNQSDAHPVSWRLSPLRLT